MEADEIEGRGRGGETRRKRETELDGNGREEIGCRRWTKREQTRKGRKTGRGAARGEGTAEAEGENRIERVAKRWKGEESGGMETVRA